MSTKYTNIAKTVVIDTTEFVRDFHQKGPHWKLLIQYLRSDRTIRVVVPDLVCQETIRKYRERVAETVRKGSVAIKDLNRLVSSEVVVDRSAFKSGLGMMGTPEKMASV